MRLSLETWYMLTRLEGEEERWVGTVEMQQETRFNP